MTQAIHRVMHEIKRRRLRVLRVTELTPRMRRITLGGEQLSGFYSPGADDHIKLFFASNAAEEAALAQLLAGGDGGPHKPAMRDYTPRRIDLERGELDIDFVIHGDGPASTWAERAQPGDHLHIAGPRGSLIVPDIFDSYLLIGDETALPAIARRLEELPAHRQALVVVQIEDDAERQPLHSAAGLQVIWALRHQADLLQTVRELTLPAGQLWAWVATEKGLARQIKAALLDHHQVPEANVKAAGYWRAEGTPEQE
ncbi:MULTISPECIES: siderophore-interacting protein [unclassified Pseudomonas]|uniref:siderophore-interacting protein n=1 Tax=unclassified Pseudomonas TaxID=196821 RepID=UPI000BD8F254|nr:MULTISPECIES: siderophore-interacting protein [unclassified Pseudomonas]PVZ13928.1 NADPH-dependent ferric siderophore reductase [Pseudomonas sp. URIL14HWK12:I12]PVZ24234.1 NADPH-dependent ferric siderophore reductase [Pseudomonas sp. URIL14HWK12:I10]PVZ33127.1 NADPH-dependent ferric siderophore reductase [Pseudomonas sp. URIL14HWK12:I11]SNZ10472.1 NADPH-dependent ferric siderophore reductase, contains FAD-binding and SIP domains [Pseudomonas sp. URIL14HWK12:I9]